MDATDNSEQEYRQLRTATREDIIDFMNEKMKPVIKDTIYKMSNVTMLETQMDLTFLAGFTENIRKQLPNEWKDVLLNGLASYTFERGIFEVTKKTLEPWVSEGNSRENLENLNLIKQVYLSI